LLHLTFKCEDPKIQHLLRLLDGTRNRADLLQAMRDKFPETPAAEIEEHLEPSLRLFYRAGAFEA
jgi:hypothetical protein